MISSFKKTLFSYTISLFVIITLTGVILSQVNTNIYVLLAVLLIEFIVLVLTLFYVFDKYIKPIDKATETMEKLLKGNYRARIHMPNNGMTGELSKKINALARNLNELTIQEQIQAEQLSTVIDNSESGLVLIDERGFVHVVNRKFLSMFGSKSQDYIGHLYYDVIDNEQIHHTVQETFLYEKNIKHLFSHEKNDEKVYLEVVGAPIFNEFRMLKGCVLVIYDITEFKNLEVMRKDFVANVSHELKTPITSIKGFAETLLDGAAEEKENRDYFLSIIHEESKRIQRLIEDLLILSKLEKDEIQLNFNNIQMTNIIKEINPIMKHALDDKNIDCLVSINPEDVSFDADEEKVKQVLINLLTNAINYTSENGEIVLEVNEEGDNVKITVKDTGIGIDHEALPRIFERFYRVDKARSRETGGTGLGLAIVKHVIEVHNGQIEVESELNKGTTFTVYLPKSQPVKKHTKEEKQMYINEEIN